MIETNSIQQSLFNSNNESIDFMKPLYQSNLFFIQLIVYAGVVMPSNTCLSNFSEYIGCLMPYCNSLY
jgi:hypothetical protein